MNLFKMYLASTLLSVAFIYYAMWQTKSNNKPNDTDIFLCFIPIINILVSMMFIFCLIMDLIEFISKLIKIIKKEDK